MPDATHTPRDDESGEPGAVVDFPRARPSHNLPLELTSFIGRERELAGVKQLLSGDTRLLTLLGPGGCGKTRLALAVARDLAGSYPDGIWLVELASLSEEALVPQAVASALEVRERPGRPLDATLADALRAERMLLVLDNCEHLIHACARLVETILISCPGLRLLATSREALGVAGEVNWIVPPLSVPDAAHPTSLEDSTCYEAVGLFVERARSRVPGFELTRGNAAAVAEVCRKLDGIPLAVELAAARIGVLSVEQISTRLEDSLGLLTAGSRTAQPRQRTLRGTLDWSYELLSEPERKLLERLSVFAGGWTFEAAEAVSGGLEEGEFLDSLSRLVDKSLVSAKEGQEGALRYRMLEPVRRYVREKLEASGEADAVRRRHAAWFLEMVEEAEPELKGPQQGAWLERLELEHDNLRAALSWALESAEAELSLRLGGVLGEFWIVRGHLSEGRRWLEAALANDDAPEPARAKALARAGWITWEQGDYERSTTLNEEGLALYRKLGDEAGIALALYTLGYVEFYQNELERASALIEEAITLQRASGDKAGVARSLAVLGFVAVARHDYDRAVTLHEEGMALALTAGDDFAIGSLLILGALACLSRGEHRRASALCEEGLQLSRRLKIEHLKPGNLHASAVFAGSQGQPARSARLWGAAEASREAIGTHLSLAERSWFGPHIAAARARLGESAWQAAWEEGRAMTPEQAVEYALGESPPAEPASLPVAEPSPRPEPLLRIFALGQARVERDGYALPSDWTYARSRELFYYLLSHPARTRERIGLALWPEASSSQLRRTFHVTLHRLRKALGEEAWISFDKGRYSFNRSLGYWFDVEAFESNLAEARRLWAEAPARAIQRLEEAVELYRGDFLEDYLGGEWALARQEELRRAYQEALLDLGRFLSEERRYAEAAEVYRSAIGQDRLFEAAHRGFMRSLAHQGERGRALKHYRSLVELLRDELDTSPAPETSALYESLRRGEE